MSENQPPPGWMPHPNTKPASIDNYAPPRSGLPLLIIGAVLVVAILTALYVFAQPPKLNSAPANTPSPTASSGPTWGMPFVTEDEVCAGMWAITSQQWTGQGLVIQIRAYSESCPINLSFTAVDNIDATTHDPETSPGFLEYGSLHLEAGQERSGTIVFSIPRLSYIIMMTDDTYAQLSALEVTG